MSEHISNLSTSVVRPPEYFKITNGNKYFLIFPSQQRFDLCAWQDVCSQYVIKPYPMKTIMCQGYTGSVQ